MPFIFKLINEKCFPALINVFMLVCLSYLTKLMRSVFLH